MILITRQEADMLRASGQGKDVHMSSKEHKGRAKRYYATENPKTMALLEDFREHSICYSTSRTNRTEDRD